MRKEKSVTVCEKEFAAGATAGQSSERLSLCILAVKCNMQSEAQCPELFSIASKYLALRRTCRDEGDYYDHQR